MNYKSGGQGGDLKDLGIIAIRKVLEPGGLGVGRGGGIINEYISLLDLSGWLLGLIRRTS